VRLDNDLSRFICFLFNRKPQSLPTGRNASQVDNCCIRIDRSSSRLSIKPVEIGAHILERGKAPPPIDQRLGFQLSLDPALFAAGVGEDAPMRVVNKTASGMIKFRVLAATVDPDDVGKILNRARFEQRDPVVIAYGGPTGDD